MKHKIRRFFRKFKEPIAKKELLRFIAQGLLASILFAALLGALEFLVYFTPFSFLTMFVFIAYYLFLIKRLKGSFYFYHITYSILAVVFLILGDYVMRVSGSLIQHLYMNVPIQSKIFSPVFQFSFLFNWALDPFLIIINLLSIAIYGVIIYFTYERMK